MIKINDKIAKEIAKELRLIRIELQKMNAPKIMSDEGEVLMSVNDALKELPKAMNSAKAGERVRI